MSSTTKKKHVCREVLDDYVLPTGNQKIVRVVAGRGNNLHEVVDSLGKSFLVSMPTKFRKSVWIKRGDFVIVDPIEEGDKVQAEIITILYRDQIRYIKGENLWPIGFDEKSMEKSPSPFAQTSSSTSCSPPPPNLPPLSTLSSDNSGEVDRVVVVEKTVFESGVPNDLMPPSEDEDEDYDSDEEFRVVNPNRPQAPAYESSSEEDSDEDDDDNDGDGAAVGGELGESMKRCHIIPTQAAHCQG